MERNEPAAGAADSSGMPPEVADLLEPDAPAAASAPEQDTETEFARRLGWRPKEEYRGPEHKWVDADQFIKRTQTEAPLLRSQLRRQDEKLQQQERLLKDQGEALKELLDRSRGAEARGFEYAIERIDAEMKEAVKNADEQSFDRLKHQREELLKMKPAAKEAKRQDDPPRGAAPPDPAVTSWVQQNAWFSSDKKLNKIAIGLEADLMEDEPHLSTSERLSKVADEVKRRFPEKFENAARGNPPAAARPGPQGVRPAAGKKTKTFDDIPAGERDAAKTAFAMIQRRTPALTAEQYLKDYFK